eukprot:TRINITY_DN3293_c0_g1_i2.p1 TRINITY_DN3293_c0_g1~~TRINITY_DN3293_c0_g1_i2.p1  ORF type:complete len:143 (+),score=21.43 TRINITY_DN3293_c0_g1_i2:60-431(+)
MCIRDRSKVYLQDEQNSKKQEQLKGKQQGSKDGISTKWNEFWKTLQNVRKLSTPFYWLNLLMITNRVNESMGEKEEDPHQKARMKEQEMALLMLNGIHRNLSSKRSKKRREREIIPCSGKCLV